MLKSLFSGVSGLQSHQIAMDVESNNIANVNTIGYKYSRANFADLLAQTSKIATAPQGDLGGKNAMQVGLGTSVASVTRIHSQGSIQNTDKNTDVAIQGDGFFIVSSDGGNTYKYTRSGDFKFDALGNFVDNNGFVVQGWLRDEATGIVDSTAPIQNILIPPGLTTPAQASAEITIKANLNSGDLLEQYSVIENLDETAGLDPTTNEKEEGFGVLFDASGEALRMIGNTSGNIGVGNGPIVGGQGINVSFNNGTTTKEYRYTSDATLAGTWVVDPTVANPVAGSIQTGAVYYFQTTEDLRAGLQEFARDPQADGAANNNLATAKFINGKLVLENPDDGDGGPVGNDNLQIVVSAITNAQDPNVVENSRFTQNMLTLQGGLIEAGGLKQSQAFNAATHSASIDIFDSLGTKHTIRVDFRKINNTAAGSEWSYTITSPSGTDIGGLAPNVNIIEGSTISSSGANVTFGNNGELTNVSLPSFDFTGNNGSAPNQTVTLNFGSIGGFDGLTSFDNPSATSGISQDGFPGGDLVGIRIDQSGTLVGSFTNGRSFGLAQISMAKFANNEGLVGDGGNVYLQSANSGDPIIGTAATAGRGFIQSSALEASNVDLSKALTQLIIIQRGYQANGKTITTSDTLLETLIGLKR
jgi:flagellar hook protein FlgE